MEGVKEAINVMEENGSGKGGDRTRETAGGSDQGQDATPSISLEKVCNTSFVRAKWADKGKSATVGDVTSEEDLDSDYGEFTNVDGCELLLDQLRTFEDMDVGWENRSHVSVTLTVDFQDTLLFKEHEEELVLRNDTGNDTLADPIHKGNLQSEESLLQVIQFTLNCCWIRSGFV